jgi:hypothetical protein
MPYSTNKAYPSAGQCSVYWIRLRSSIGNNWGQDMGRLGADRAETCVFCLITVYVREGERGREKGERRQGNLRLASLTIPRPGCPW